MALMEDTGWYLPNYDMAEELKWGKNLGCDFALKSCKDWMESRRAAGKSIHPYCNKVKRDPLETECTEDRSSVALCNLVHHGHLLPPPFQNFDSIPHVSSLEVGYYGGSVALADYCPYIQVSQISLSEGNSHLRLIMQEFTWRSNNVVVRGSHCAYIENQPSEYEREQYNSDRTPYYGPYNPV